MQIDQTTLGRAILAHVATYGTSPRIVIACVGGTDEHAQLWLDDDDVDMPMSTVIGTTHEAHPDAPSGDEIRRTVQQSYLERDVASLVDELMSLMSDEALADEYNRINEED
jgi:hypothetical protein